MNETRTVPLTMITTAALWSLALILLGSSWIVMAVGPHHVAYMLGFTACAFIGFAAVATLRCQAQRTRALIRVAYGLESRGTADLHALR